MSAEVKINDIQVVNDNHGILRSVSYELKKKNGSWQTQKRQVYDHGNAVTALLYNKEKRTVLLTNQFRIASYLNGNKEGMLMETCAGILEDNTPEEGIKREIKEETGYELDDVKKVFEVYMSPGAYAEQLHFFIAEYRHDQKVSKGGGLEEEQEEIELIELEFEKAYQMIQTGEIKDAKTVMLLLYAKANNLM